MGFLSPKAVLLVLPTLIFSVLTMAAEPDVVVVGGTPAGIAASVAAARLGRHVTLVAPEDHIGGILANGLTNSDILNTWSVGGLFYEFTRRVLRYYQTHEPTSGDKATNVKLCHDGYWFEPSVAERLFHEMIEGEQGRVTLLLEHRLREVRLEGQRLTAIVVEHDGERRTLHAGVFIDATYEGDLAALAKVPYRVGREGRDEYGEPHAGFIYARFGTTEPLPGSTGVGDQAIQAFCFRFHMTDNPVNRVTVSQPDGYDRKDYRAVLADIRAGRVTQLRQVIQFYAMPNGRYEINSDHPHPDTGVSSESLDLSEENWGWPEAGPAERQRLYQRHLTHNVGLIWFLQHDPEVPAPIRDEAAKFGWCRDEWPGNHHLPRQVYVREGRRILGEYVLTERDGDLDPATQRTRLQSTSIAVADYAFDSHGCHRFDPAHPGVREGYIYIAHRPMQIPYGVVVPQQVDGLLVPVACSASHVGYSAVRMEPVFMALGEACGVAAHLSLRAGIQPRSIPVPELQHLLVGRGAVITYYNDLPFDHLAFASLQWLGARSLNPGYQARPDMKLTRATAAERFRQVMVVVEKKTWQPPNPMGDEPLRGRDLADWLRQAGLKTDFREIERLSDRELNLAQFASLLYRSLRSVGLATISEAKRDEHGFLVHTVESEFQAGTTEIRVLLPVQREERTRYPVVYVLPVEARTEHHYGDGLLEVQRHDLHNQFRAIFVSPSFSHLPWYADHPVNPEIRQESYFLNVVVPFIEQRYPAQAGREGRLLLGFSKSGWGAWSLLLRYPDRFDRAAAWDAPLMMDRPGEYGSGSIFGTQENFEDYQITRLLKRLAAELRDHKRLILSGYGNFRGDHERTHSLLMDLGIPHVDQDGPRREHRWESGWVPDVSRALLEGEKIGR